MARRFKSIKSRLWLNTSNLRKWVIYYDVESVLNITQKIIVFELNLEVSQIYPKCLEK